MVTTASLVTFVATEEAFPSLAVIAFVVRYTVSLYLLPFVDTSCFILTPSTFKAAIASSMDSFADCSSLVTTSC